MKKRYQHVPLVSVSIFDLKDSLGNGDLYIKSSPHSYTRIVSEQKLIDILAEDQLVIYRKEEIDWRNKVSEYVISEGIIYSCNGVKHIKGIAEYTDEQFLEMCRVALRANGELE